MPSKRQAPSASLDAKRLKKEVDESVGEFLCPITHSLPVDPVTAEDGHIYERKAIEDWLSKGRRTSPITNEAMGVRLTTAVQARNMIERMVRSGAVTGEKAEPWKKHIKDIEDEKFWLTQAENGSGDAMGSLALLYFQGSDSIKKDIPKALHWATKGANMDHAVSMNQMAKILLSKGESHETESMYWLSRAAENGVEHACYRLGFYFQKGKHGLPQNTQQAIKWYSRMRTCRNKTVTAGSRNAAADFVRQQNLASASDPL